MTWFADDIILPATPKARDVVRSYRPFASRAYLLDHWERQDGTLQKTDGVLFIRPVLEEDDEPFEWRETWHGDDVLDWSRITEEGGLPPWDLPAESGGTPSLVSALEGLAQVVEVPVVHYSCGFWGGECEYELGKLIGRRQTRMMEYSLWDERWDPNAEVAQESGDVLMAVLQFIGIDQMAPYFQPYERSFPWEAHRLT